MRRALAEQKDSSMKDVNLTPLIDVSLVLVVILLLATPLAFESSIGVNNTQRSGRAAEDVKQTKRLELEIVDDVTVRVNQAPINIEFLAAYIDPILRSAPDQLVVVSCADAVSHGAFVRVLDDAKAHGAAQIAVVESAGVR